MLSLYQLRYDHFMRKKIIIGIGSLVLLANASSFAGDVIAKVIAVSGVVTLQSAQSDKIIVKRGQDIRKNQRIVASDSGSAKLRFTDDSVFILYPKTDLDINQYRMNKKNKRANRFVAKVTEGSFRTVTGAISQLNRAGYSIKTPVALIGVRGTDYRCCNGGVCGFSKVKLNSSTSIVMPKIKRSNVASPRNTGVLVLRGGTTVTSSQGTKLAMQGQFVRALQQTKAVSVKVVNKVIERIDDVSEGDSSVTSIPLADNGAQSVADDLKAVAIPIEENNNILLGIQGGAFYSELIVGALQGDDAPPPGGGGVGVIFGP